MTSAVITVAGITPPAAGKKQGDIIDTQGNKWKVWGDKLHLYQMGATYNINYDTNEFKGQNFNVVKTVSPAIPQQSVPPAPHTPQSAPPNAPQGQQFTAKDKLIYICGLMNNTVGNPSLNPLELTLIELKSQQDKYEQLWRATFGKRSDMDDEIPF